MAGTMTITATVYAGSQMPMSCAKDADCAQTGMPTCRNNACVVTASATFNVEVTPATLPPCTGTASSPSPIGAGQSLSLGMASIAVQPSGVNTTDTGSYLWAVEPFPATIACGAPTVPSGYEALGPPITFAACGGATACPKAPADLCSSGACGLALKREIPFAIPINPALMPNSAYVRHIRVAYSGPAFKTPRIIPVADAHIAELAGKGKPTQWALTFKAPRLGTYQAVIDPGAGTKTFSRQMTHRGVVGISMGGGGTATFGMRHHNTTSAASGPSRLARRSTRSSSRPRRA
jgi:hypothetical protein